MAPAENGLAGTGAAAVVSESLSGLVVNGSSGNNGVVGGNGVHSCCKESVNGNVTNGSSTNGSSTNGTNGNGRHSEIMAAAAARKSATSGSTYVPYGVRMVERRAPGIFGIGTANPPHEYKMEDFARLMALEKFNIPPEAASFVERICKSLGIHHLPGLLDPSHDNFSYIAPNIDIHVHPEQRVMLQNV